MTDAEEIINAIFFNDYSNSTFTSCLYEMFGKQSEAIEAYIKEGREFWHYDGDKSYYRKLTVTYIRSGVMFFTYNDEPDIEHAWFIGSFNAASLFAAQIYPYEIGKILSKWFENADTDFPEICKQCKWCDCNGKITVEVIWDDYPIRKV